MEIQVTLSNNEVLKLKAETPIRAFEIGNEFIGENGKALKQGYLNQIFEGLVGDLPLDTSMKTVGISGLLGEADYFMINNIEQMYKTSSIVSIV